MKRINALICWLLICSQCWAGITYHGTTGQTLYARIQTASSTFKGVALTEGSSGGLGVYNVTDAALVSAGLSSSDGDYPFTIRSGTASDTANDAIVASGTLGWTGTVERPTRSNATYFGNVAGTFASGIPAVNATQLNGTALTGRDIGASVLLSTGTGTGQLDFTSGVVKSNVTQYGGTAGTFANGIPYVHPSGIGKTFYLAASGGNDGNSGRTRSAAFATVTAALAALTSGAGDTLVLIGGSYADDGTNPFMVVNKDCVTIRGDGPLLTVINDTSFDSGIWLSGVGCTCRDLKVVGTNAGDIGVNATGNWSTVENCDLSTHEAGLILNGDHCVARRVKAAGGRYGIRVGGDNYLLDHCTGSTSAIFTYTSNSNFAGIYLPGTKSGEINGGSAIALCGSATSTGKLFGLSCDGPAIVRGLEVGAFNLSAGLTGGTYGVGSFSGAATLLDMYGGSISVTGSTGTAKEIDGSVSGSYIGLHGTNTNPANWIGTSNIHRYLEADSRYNLTLDSSGNVHPQAGSITATEAPNLDAAVSTRATSTALAAVATTIGTPAHSTVVGDIANVSGGGTPAQVHNNEPDPARTSKLGTRADGVTIAFPVQTIRPGEKTQIWVDCSKYTNVNLANVANAASSNGAEVSVSSVGMYGKLVSFMLDGTSATDGDTATITCDATPAGSQVIKVSVAVKCSAN